MRFITAVLLSAPIVQLHATEHSSDPGQVLQQESERQVSVALPTDPNLRWAAYLKENGLVDGLNSRNGRKFFIAMGEARVGKALKSDDFIKSRTVAYNKAILTAKSDLAETVGAELGSDRSFQMFEEGGEFPPAMEKVKEELSIMDKARTLSSLALDDQIKKYDPSWDGTGKTKEEKQQKLAIQTEKYQENLKQNARLFLQGTSPIFNAEGPSDDGYSVVVGIVWSPNMAKVAEAMYNPSASLPPGMKKPTINKQIEDMLASNPDTLASTMGVRVWRNEKGELTVVSFAAESVKKSPTIAKKKSAMSARAQMAQFISESVVSNSSLSGNETIMAFDDESTETYDEEKFEQTISAKAKDIKLSGASSVYTWKGKHPNSGQKMFVNVLAWSPSSQQWAVDIENQANGQQERMATGGAGKFASKTHSTSSHGSATGGLSGAQSSPEDF
ncbi:hypothetical protein N9235_02115 [Gammaproteobacteria bacterium]|nr:hypothetical protein [Gammaproteobacteria bacterium]